MNEDFKKFVDNYKAWKAENHKEMGLSRKEFLALSQIYEAKTKKKLSDNVSDEVIKNYFS